MLALYIDIYMLDHDGNLIDTSALAAMSALLSTRMPKVEDGKIIRGEFSGKLPLKEKVVTCTFGRLGSKSFLDPSLDEEKGMDCRLTHSHHAAARVRRPEGRLGLVFGKGFDGACRHSDEEGQRASRSALIMAVIAMSNRNVRYGAELRKRAQKVDELRTLAFRLPQVRQEEGEAARQFALGMQVLRRGFRGGHYSLSTPAGEVASRLVEEYKKR